jgi:phosphatidylinositol glycan class C protein
MSNHRRLWTENDGSLSSKDEAKTSNLNTYQSIFEHYSIRPKLAPLNVLALRGLVVGQEFILSCLLLVSHRFALSQESYPTQISSRFLASSEIKYPLLQETQISLILVTWAIFLLLVAFYSKPAIDNNNKSVSRQHKFRLRLTDAVFTAILLRFLSSVLRTLTASYSSDTVHALAISSLLLHLFACDYNYANGWNQDQSSSMEAKKRPTFKGGTLSLTAVFFATTLLASRLEGNVAVYLFVSYSVILFALYPSARHQVSINTQTVNRVGK